MNQTEQMNVYYIPDYIHQTLISAGITPANISMLTTHNTENNANIITKITNNVSNHISKYDLLTISALNHVVNEYLKTSYDSNYILTSLLNKPFITPEAITEVLNMYLVSNITTEELLHENDKKKLFTVESHNNVLFIIVHAGFTNLVIDNNVTSREILASLLIDYLFKSLDEDKVFKTNIFKSLHRLVTSKI